MNMDKNNIELAWASIILRLAMISLFAVAGIAKFIGGYQNAVAMVAGSVKGSFLPEFLINIYAHILPFAEVLIALWLLSGIKLRAAWIFTAFVLISLGFGLTVAKQNGADVYMYVLIACAGLILSRYDCGCPCSKK